jgi:hypothetical protein
VIETEPFTKPRDTGRAMVFNVAMTTSSGSARTAPKGKATPTRNADGRGRGRAFLTPTIQWILVTIAGLAVVGAIIYFGSDIGDGGGDHSGYAPVAVVTESPSPT